MAILNMRPMQVDAINWISRASEEAEVTISGGGVRCDAFSQPCVVEVGNHITEPLHVFDARSVMISRATEPSIQNIPGAGLGRKVVAVLVDPTEQIFAVGGIYLLVEEHLPGGIQPEDLVEFECSRIDLW